LKLAANLGASGPIAGGRQWWSWVHIDDVAGCLVHLLEGEHTGAFNIASPDARRQRDFARTLARVMHRPLQIPAPGFAVRAILGGFAVELIASRHVIPAATLAAGYEFAQPDLQPALESLISSE
jgi:NAD dependent epimerase/dehydratase family enzyme